jgi:CheY-like chemotaxis protein
MVRERALPVLGAEFTVRKALWQGLAACGQYVSQHLMKNILIIEDDAVVGFVYRTQFEKHGFAVECVTDGPSGLSRIQEVQPDGIVLDLMLPGMNGVEILRHIRAQEQFSKTPVIVFTNAYVPALIEEAMKAGATRVFNKSQATPTELVEALKLAGCSAQDQ